MISGADAVGFVVITDVVDMPECTVSRKGTEYRGLKNITQEHETCQSWTSQTVSLAYKHGQRFIV